MADIESNIRIEIDTSSALASIKALQSQVSQFQKEMSTASAASANQAKNLQRQLVADINATGQFSAGFQKIRSTSESFTNALEKNKLSMGEYFRFAGGSTKTFSRLFTNEFNTIEKVARERVKTLQTQYVSLGRDASGALQSIAVRPLSLDMNNLGTQTAMAAQRQQIFNQLLKQGSTNLLNFGKNTQWAGRQLMVGFTIPLSIFGGMASKTFMDLEKQAIRFKRVFGDAFSTDQEADAALGNMRDLALEFTKYGVEVEKTLELAADAAQMGLQGAALRAQVSEATRLAVLGEVEQQEALKTTISLTNAFGIAASDLASKIDFLNAVENETMTAISDLTIAIPKAAPVVRQLGGGVEELAFFLTAMKEGGINASEGANALKSGLASLINPTSVATDMLQRYGINIREIVESNRGDVSGLVIEFASALDKLDPLQRARAIEQMFGKFQFARISTLFKNVIEEGNQAQKVLELTNATTSELADVSARELSRVEESTTFRFKKATEEFKAAMAPVGEEFLKLITPLVEIGTEILRQFNNMSDGSKSFVTGLVGILGGVAPIFLMTFGLVANGVANIIKGFAVLRNTFLNLGSNSKVLGDQIDYMTQEQLEAAAVAASLNQTHSNLIQTFTSEAGAISNLTAAYQKLITTQSGMRVAPIPTTIGRSVPGFAKGGIVNGPGSGTSDSILAMISNGEAIIPAKAVQENPSLVKLLVEGKELPGFAKGLDPARAHLSNPFARDSQQFRSGVEMAGLQSLAAEFPKFIKVVSNLVAEIPQKVNIGLVKGLEQSKFSEAFQGRENKMLSSAKLGGLDVSIQENINAVNLLEKEIHDAAIQMADATQDKKVNDEVLAKATRSVIDANKSAETAVGKAARAFDAASKQVGQVRVQVPTADVRSGLESGKFSKGSLGKVMFDDTQVARESQSTPGKFRPASSYNPSKSYARQVLMSVEQGAIDGINEAAQSASPSKKAKQAGKNIADGAIQGVQENDAKAKAAGQELAADVMAGASQSRRRATSGGVITIGDPRNARSVKDPKSGNIMSLDKYEKQIQSRIVAEQRLGKMQVVSSERLSRMNNGLQSGVFALTSLAGAASMMGGAVGDVAGKVFQLSGVLFALMQVTQLLTQANFLQLIQKRKNIAGEAVEAAIGAKTISAGGGFLNFLKTAAIRVAAFLGPIGMVIAGMVALGGIIGLVIAEQNKQKKAVSGLGDTAFLTAEKMKAAGDLLGFEPKTSAFGQNIVAGTAAPSSIDQGQSIQSLRESKNFAKDFKDQIDAVMNASVSQAEFALRSLAIRLASSGAPKEAVDSIVKAIAQEAGRTELDLSFTGMDLSANPEEISSQALAAADMYAQAYAAGVAERTEMYLRADGHIGFRATKVIIKDSRAEAELAAAAFAASFQALRDGLSSGIISASQFNSEMTVLNESLTRLEDDQLAMLLPTMSERLGLTEDTFKDIKNLRDQLLLIQADAAGIEISESAITAFELAGMGLQESKDAAKWRQILADKIKNQALEQENLNKALEEQELLNETIEAGKQDIENQTIALKNQRLAYELLTESGYDAAEAFELAGNAALAASIVSASTATDAAAQMGDILSTVNAFLAEKALQIKSPTASGAGSKSPFQEAIDNLKEQRKEIQNTNIAYNKLRQAGVGISDAFDAAQDSVLATALASTKVGTKQWKELLSLIKQIDDAASKSAVRDLLRQQASVRELNSAFVTVAQTLGKMGFEAAEINDILSQPALAKEFIKDLKDGKLDSKLIRDYLNGIEKDKRIRIQIDMATPEGIQSEFEKLFGEAMESFRVRRDRVESDFRDRTKSAQAAIDSTKDAIEEVQEEIDGIQTIINQKQREIELSITRPIEEFQKTISGLQRGIELQFSRPIADLQEESSDLANDLSLMDREIGEINEKYDTQLEALEKILSINEALAEEQSAQLDVADALSRGDIAAAARAAQALQRQQAAQRAEASAQRIEQAREIEVERVKNAAGMTRKQIEERQFEISQQIYALEEQREVVQAEILGIQDQIYTLEQLRESKLLDIRNLEDQIFIIQNGRLLQLQTELRDRENILEKIEEEKQLRLGAIALEEQAWNDVKLQFDEAMQRGKDYVQMLLDAMALIEKLSKLTPTAPSSVGGSSGTTGGAGGGGGTSGSSVGRGTGPTPVTQQPPRNPETERPLIPTGGSLIGNITIAPITAAERPTPAQAAAALNANIPQSIARQIARATPAETRPAPKPPTTIKPVGGGGARGPMFMSAGGIVPRYLRAGGLLPYKSEGGSIFKPLGTDTIPAMLTPGEFVVQKYAVEKFGVDNLKAINSGASPSDSVYNYSVNVNVKSDANPDQIARAVMTQIKQVDSMRLRGSRF